VSTHIGLWFGSSRTSVDIYEAIRLIISGVMMMPT